MEAGGSGLAARAVSAAALGSFLEADLLEPGAGAQAPHVTVHGRGRIPQNFAEYSDLG